MKIIFKRKPLWKKQFEIIKKYRQKNLAPVDLIGCDKFIDSQFDEKTNNFYVFLGAFLSSQTNDKITYECVMRFKENMIDSQVIKSMPIEDLSAIIKPVGFYNTKAKNLKKICETINNNNGIIPSDIKSLLSFPGIGNKMAVLISNILTGKPQGICVDTHVHRVLNRLGWINTKTPDLTRKELEKFIPQNYWHEINNIFVGYGQTICKARTPLCNSCPVKNSCKFTLNL